MFSSDRNIEAIADLVEAVKKYASIKSRLVKIDIVDKVVRILTTLTVVFVLAFIIVLALIYMSFAAAFAIGDAISCMPLGFLIVALCYALLFFIFFVNRKSWIERPLVRWLSSLLHD